MIPGPNSGPEADLWQHFNVVCLHSLCEKRKSLLASDWISVDHEVASLTHSVPQLQRVLHQFLAADHYGLVDGDLCEIPHVCECPHRNEKFSPILHTASVLSDGVCCLSAGEP
jgi:hypothetical protein